jgi:hypothetical protein
MGKRRNGLIPRDPAREGGCPLICEAADECSADASYIFLPNGNTRASLGVICEIPVIVRLGRLRGVEDEMSRGTNE